MFFPDITLEHAGQLEFTYQLRVNNQASSTCQPYHMADYDQRLRNHLAGLLPDFDSVSEHLMSQLHVDQPGTVFAACIAWTARGLPWPSPIHNALSASSAALWAAADTVALLATPPVDSTTPTAQAASIAATPAYGSFKAKTIGSAVESEHSALRLAGLRAAGRLRITELRAMVSEASSDDNDDVRFEAARSALLLGQERAATVLGEFLNNQSGNAWQAAMILGAWLSPEALRAQASVLAKSANRRWLAARLAGYSGDPAMIGGLLRMLDDTSSASFAAESIGLITGLDIRAEGLVTESVVHTDAMPVAGLNLPFPDADGVRQWWAENQQLFPTSAGPFLLGERRDERRIAEVLASGNQHARHFAAWLSAAANHHEPIVSVTGFSH